MQLGEIEDSLMEKWKAITGHSLLNFRFNKPVDRVAIYCPGRAGRIRVKSYRDQCRPRCGHPGTPVHPATPQRGSKITILNALSINISWISLDYL